MGTHPRSRAVLVGVDGSASALTAVRWAAEEAARRSAPLRLVTVSPWARDGGETAADPSNEVPVWETELRTTLDVAASSALEVAPGLVVSREVLGGFAVERLRSESTRVGLLVMGGCVVGGLTGMLGSIAGAVAAAAECPVVVVRGGTAVEPAAPVVVGVDGSTVSEAALGFAYEAADIRQVPLLVVHSWYDPMLDAGTAPGWDWQAFERREDDALAGSLTGWSGKYPAVVVRRQVTGAGPVPVLVERSGTAGLVVVGSHGRGGLAGQLLGSVSQALLHHSHCPVAVVHPDRQDVGEGD